MAWRGVRDVPGHWDAGENVVSGEKTSEARGSDSLTGGHRRR